MSRQDMVESASQKTCFLYTYMLHIALIVSL